MTNYIAGYRGNFQANPMLDDLKKEMFDMLVNKPYLCHSPHEVRDLFAGDPCQCPGQVMYALPYDQHETPMPLLKLAILVSERKYPYLFRPLVISDCHKVHPEYGMLIGKKVISVENAIHIQCNQPTV